MRTAQGTLWVCSSCLLTYEGDGADPCGCAPSHWPWSREMDTDVTHGLTCDIPDHWRADPDGHAGECEKRDFDSRPCDACGCPLAGERHAYTWWADDYDADYYPPCPICGDPCDYCPGHPRLDCGCSADLTWHDDDCPDDRAGERTDVR